MESVISYWKYISHQIRKQQRIFQKYKIKLKENGCIDVTDFELTTITYPLSFVP